MCVGMHTLAHVYRCTCSPQRCQRVDYEATHLIKRVEEQMATQKDPRKGGRKKRLETQLDAQSFRREVGESEKTFIEDIQRQSME